jgi:hypothetical protein
MLLAQRLAFASDREIRSLLAQASEVSKMLRSLNQALQRKVA